MTNLTATYTDNTWAVDDEDGGRWFPDDDALAVIYSSDDPAATAVELCREDPQMGHWAS